MSRKDTIIIAVLMNVALLTVLFITAMQFDDEPATTTTNPTELADLGSPQEETLLVTAPELPADEVDQVLKVYAAETQEAPAPKIVPPVPTPSQMTPAPVEAPKVVATPPAKGGEVVVKKGDTLDKIARANKTTVKELKKVNQLTSDNLRVGQKLSLPIASLSPKPQPGGAEGAVYHEVKSGDSPWKIAKKYNISYEDILELNHLDDAKARNLKIGDKLRIK